MSEKIWLLQNVRGSSEGPRPVVLYGLKEHPFHRWSGGGGAGVFQQLLQAGHAAPAAALLRELPPELPLELSRVSALLVTSGWHRFGSTFAGDVYRVVVAQRSGSRFEHLTRREFGAAELAARGWKSRRIGDALGIAAPTVRGALDRAVTKLELASGAQLPLLWFTLGSSGRSLEAAGGLRYLMFETRLSLLTDPLTSAERALVERLLLGDAHRAIAAHRGVSVRTIANQMSRLFEKLAVSSRAELIVRLLERARRH